jgi:hypothetical protein
MVGFKILLLSGYLLLASILPACGQSNQLKLVFIRHAEKQDLGDNLNCRGLNRSLLLPGVLYKKYGKASAIYVPLIHGGNTTKHSRMLQTISPYAIRYDLAINSSFEENDAKGLSQSLLLAEGTVFIVWEHKNIAPVLRCLGIRIYQDWPGDDFDSIWIVTFQNGKPVLSKDKEKINPSADCLF